MPIVAFLPGRTNAPWWHEYVMQARELRFVRRKVSLPRRSDEEDSAQADAEAAMAQSMTFTVAQLHVLYQALCRAVEWESTLADAQKPHVGALKGQCLKQYRISKAAELQYSNMREYIGRHLRGENKRAGRDEGRVKP